MNAETVHTIFKALPMEEQTRLYSLISKDIHKVEQKKKSRKKKNPIISDTDARNLLLEKIFKVKTKKS